ncbi:MAG: hypothetical protein FD129_948 [bacterium]|nr:MAG: hypothetical protein FD129_948 [bacterium]
MTRSRPRGRILLAAWLLLAAGWPSMARAATADEIQKQIDEGRLLEAVDAATLLVTATPTDCRGWRLLGDANRRLTRTQAAAQAYRTGLGACPEDKELLRTFGLMLEEAEQYEEAAPILARYWALDPGDAAVGSRLGAACYRAGKCQEGRTAYDALLAAHPARSTDRLAYAQLLSRVCHDFPAARVQFEKLLVERPNDPAVLCAWVYALAEVGMAEEAAKAAAGGLSTAGESAGCLYAAWGRALEGAGDSLMIGGEVEKARALYLSAIDPLTKGTADPVFGGYCEAILAQVKYKESPMEELKP